MKYLNFSKFLFAVGLISTRDHRRGLNGIQLYALFRVYFITKFNCFVDPLSTRVMTYNVLQTLFYICTVRKPRNSFLCLSLFQIKSLLTSQKSWKTDIQYCNDHTCSPISIISAQFNTREKWCTYLSNCSLLVVQLFQLLPMT